jgi:hypothetical protein
VRVDLEDIMNHRMRVTWLLSGAILLSPALAAAQSSDPGPRLSVGAGAGVAFPLHGDFDFTPWAWDADVRIAMARHVLLEVAVGEWRHSESRVTENIPVTMPTGMIGRLEQKTTRVQRSSQINVLFRGSAGRVRITGGGGIGLLQHDRRTRQDVSGCSQGVTCQSFESSFSNTSFAAQAVGGAEVALAGGFAVYGQARFVVPTSDPGGGDIRVTAGVRWGFGS